MPNDRWLPGAHMEQPCLVSMANFTGNFFVPRKDPDPSNRWLSLCGNRSVSLFFHQDPLHSYYRAIFCNMSVCLASFPSIHSGAAGSRSAFHGLQESVGGGEVHAKAVYHSHPPGQSLEEFGVNSKNLEETWMGFPKRNDQDWNPNWAWASVGQNLYMAHLERRI